MTIEDLSITTAEQIKNEFFNKTDWHYDEKLVVSKTGKEKIIWINMNKKYQLVMAEHDFENKINSPQEYCNFLIEGLVKMSERSQKYNFLKETWWGRLKFIFNPNLK